MMKRLFLACLATLVAGRAYADTYTVDRTDDTAAASGCVDATPNDCSLRGAIIKANAHAGADVIVLHGGTYSLTLVGAGEDAAATGDLDIASSLTITGDGSATTTIDAAGLNDGIHTPDRAIHIDPNGTGALSVTVSGVTIQNAVTQQVAFINSAGAAILNGNAVLGGSDPVGSTVMLSDVVLQNNTSPGTGGGVANYGALTITDSLIDHNTGSSGGGGIFQGDAGSVDIVDSTVSNNTAGTGAGGGLVSGAFSINPDVPAVTILGSTFNDNSAANGGGIFHGRGKVLVVNSTISHNSSTSSGFTGGGITSNGAVTLRNSTITLNISAGAGGGIQGNVLASNTIVAGNSAGSAPDCAGTITSAGYDLIQNTSGCSIAGDTATNLTGVSAKLAALADNGGPTQTHALLDGSPAVDNGNPAAPGSGSGACEANDQRDVARPLGPRCDIGAFESNIAPCSASPLPACRTTSTKKSLLLIKKGATPAKQSLLWKWRQSSLTALADYGDPLNTTDYRLCVYDSNGLVPQPELFATAPAGATCGGKACWKARPTGFKYSDAKLTSDGLSEVILKSRSVGTTKISVSGKGAHLHFPSLPLTTPVTVQLKRVDGGPCWEATYSKPSHNTTGKFKAKSD